MNYQYEPINDEFAFEEFVKDIFNGLHGDLSFQKYGVKGQKQYGIDIFSITHKYAIQCKKKDLRKSDKEIRKELIKDINDSVEALKGLSNKIEFDDFFIISTAKRDNFIQDYANKLSKDKDYNIHFWGWDDLQPHINQKIRKKYYSHLYSIEKDANNARIEFPDEIKNMIGESDNYLENYEYDKAIDIILNAQNIAQKLNNYLVNADLNLKLAIAYIDSEKDSIKARYLLLNCLNTYAIVEDKENSAYSFYLLGLTYIDEKKYSRAKANIEQSLEIYNELKDKSGIAKCLHQIGWVYDLTGELEKALEFYNKSLSNYLVINSLDENKANWGLASCYHHIGLIRRKQGNSFEIESNLNLALEWYERGGFKREIALVKYILAMHYFNEGKAEMAFEQINESIKLYSSIREHNKVLFGLSYLSKMFWSYNLKSKAEEVATYILHYAKENNIDSDDVGYNLIRTGKMLFQPNDTTVTTYYFNKAKEFFNSKKNTLGYADTLIAFSDMEYQLDNNKLAIGYRNQAKDILKSELISAPTNNEKGVLAARIGAICGDIEEYQEAIDFYNKAKKIFKEFKNAYDLALVLGNIVICNRQLGDTKDEESTFRKILGIVEGSSFYYIKASALSNLADIEYKKGNIKTAIKLHEEACYLAEKHYLPNMEPILKACEKFKEETKPSP